MPYIKGSAATLDDLVAQTVDWVTDETVHGEDAWELMRNEPWPRGTIFKAKGLNGHNSCYIGLMVLTMVKGETYKNWLLQTNNLARYFVWAKAGLGLEGASFEHQAGNSTFSVLSDKTKPNGDKIAYALLGDIDIVFHGGSMLVFGVFKQYTEALDWQEQPGAINFNDTELDLDLYPLSYSRNGSVSTKKPPVYPGMGYPGIAIPEDEPATGAFLYWLIKDDGHLTIVTRNRTQWDIGHAGLLIPFQAAMQYPFPAVMAGSCTGMNRYSALVDGRPVIANKLDFSYTNWSLSRSMPCAPCANGPSQLALCLPDGRWRYISNWTQQLKAGTYDGSYYFALARPERINEGYLLKPTNTDLTDVTYGIDGETTIALEPFHLLQNELDSEPVNLFGTLWRMAWPGNLADFGEATVNGKACLLLPNCWEDRLWQILDGHSNVTDPATLLQRYNEIIEFGKQFRMLIQLEE